MTLSSTFAARRHSLWPAAFAVMALALPSTSWAQQPFSGTEVIHPHPTDYLVGDAQKAVIGQLTDDATGDTAILQGGQVVLLYAPARSESFQISIGTYTDIAVLPGGSANGRDALVALGSSGLVKLEWSPSALSLLPTLVAGNDWIGASLLQVVPLAAGGSHVAALTSGGDVVRLDSSGGNFSESSTVETNLAALTLAALDFNGDGYIEYALDAGNGFTIFSNAGIVLHTGPDSASPAPHLLRLPEVGQSFDALVWVTSLLPAIPQMMTVVRMEATGVDYENYMVLSPVAEEFVVADYYGNGHLDLLAVSAVDEALRVLKNKHAVTGQPTYTFGLPGTSETYWFDATNAYGASWSSAPALAAGDLDGDGDADPVLAGHESSAPLVQLFLSDGVDEDDHRPRLPTCLVYSEYPSGQTNVATLTVPIQRPVDETIGTHLRVAVWIQPDSSSPVDNEAWATDLVPMPGVGMTVTVMPTGEVSGAPEPLSEVKQIFHLQVWPVQIVGGTEVWAGPATTWWDLRSSRLSKPECKGDPTGTGGYNDPPNVQPGEEGTRTP